MKNILNNKKGFTLMELMVAIGIMALISAIAIPVCAGILEKSKIQSDEITATSYSSAMHLAWNANSTVFNETLVIEKTSDYTTISNGITEVKNIIRQSHKGTTFEPLSDDYHYFYCTWANKVVVADKNATITELNELAGNIDLVGNKLDTNSVWFDLTTDTIKY